MSINLQVVQAEGAAKICLSSISILLYDLLLTFDQEISHIWTRPLSMVALIFLFNRYSPFIDILVSLYSNLSVNTAKQCTWHTAISAWSTYFGFVTAEIILVLRTYAIWGRRRCILITFCALAVCTFIPSFVFTKLGVDSLKFIELPLRGCYFGPGTSQIINYTFILLVVSETVIAILMAIKAYEHLRASSSSWVWELYRDGIMFYLILLAVSIVNVIAPVVAPSIGGCPQRVLHSVLCNRVLFLILRSRFYDDRHHSIPLTTLLELDEISAPSGFISTERSIHSDER
ncbi:hypothetical protein C8J56DRAFT_179953 [Mycena floridula]|nr:hypothetical protein C8J56DRAFT_179953 [Mycena floridula]